ncbi:MAG: hypothetical protein A3K76_03495 [Euryarchaeota archaeon RBG_13_57_23]|nr:MAG: hypothetical protein A3K76_03495 [Euryarchaeota archaeon RBG_13_57_23]
MVMSKKCITEEAQRPRRTRMSRDSFAQVSFSVIAVVLLTATAVTGAYLAKRELDSAKADRQERLLKSMGLEAERVSEELELYAAFRANEVVSKWEEFPVNESRISEAFSSRMKEHVRTNFPRVADAWDTEVRNWTGGLFLIERTTIDLIPDESTTPARIEEGTQSMEYESSASPADEVLGQRTVNPYYVALGNFTVEITADGISLLRESSFQRPIISSLPFLEMKLRAFESASDGEFSDLGRMVAYMLSTLGELRILEGYGQPMYVQGKDTSLVLTEEDVYRAVLVALLLEQARLFRTVDGDFSTLVSGLCAPDNPGLQALLCTKDRYLDPAELFLWFMGRTRVHIDPEIVVAQAVYGVIDMMALRIMEYMGWLGTLDFASEVAEKLEDTVDSIVAFLTGEDRAKVAVVTWIENTLEAVGADLRTYSALFGASVDLRLTVPERQYFVQDAQGDLYPVWVGNTTVPIDVDTCDVLESDVWSEFYGTFKENQQSFSTSVRDVCLRLAVDVAAYAEFDSPELVADPVDDTNLFTALARSAGEVILSDLAVSKALGGGNLPLFSSHFRLAEEFAEFVQPRVHQLIDIDQLMEGVYPSLTEGVLSSAKYAYIPDLVVPVEQQLAEIVACDVENDLSWGVGARTRDAVEGCAQSAVSRLQLLINSSVTRSDDGFAGPLVDALAGFLVSGTEKFPGIGDLVENTLTVFSKAVLGQQGLSAFKDRAYVGVGGSFEFWDGDKETAYGSGAVLKTTLSVDAISLPELRVVPFDESKGYESLEHLFPTDDMLVQIKRPWNFDRQSSEYPNIHLTSLGNATATPYATQWTVSVLGLVDVEISSDDHLTVSNFLERPAESRRTVRVDLEIPVVLHSAWPLEGVGYNPSNTALSDSMEAARKFCEIVWDKLEPVFGWVKEGFERVFGFVTDVFEVLSSFATRLLKLFANSMQKFVEIMQKYIEKIAESALAKAAQWFIDLMGTVEFRVSLYGFLIIVQTNIPDLLYRHGNDVLRVIVVTNRFGPGLSFGIRLARLSDGSFDILANSTISLRKATVEVKVDPLMHILRRFAEVHCKGEGWAVDLAMPEVEPYELAEVSTADLPGIGNFLSNIPLPAIGMSASVEAGLRLKYSPPFPTDVVVNEFESNPHGEDSGNEWVELYNPLTVPRCVDGWTIETLHGKNCALGIEGTIAPSGVLVFVFPETSIDNGISDDPFNDGDAMVLRDASGATMDVTPMCRDSENDERSWQRAWDGGPRWVFRAPSRSGSNGVPVLLATSDFVAKALFEAFKDSFIQTKLEEVTPSLEFLKLFGKRVLYNLIENLLGIVNETIHEITFFVEVSLKDASGTAGVAFRTSFVVTGEAIVDVLRWLIHSFATFIVNLGKAHSPLAYPAFPTSFLSGLYVRFEVLFEVGLPNMVRLLGAVGSLDRTFACAVCISPNIPAIGRLLGRNWGGWGVDFGVYLEGVPKEFVQGFLAQDTGDMVDFWLVKGRAYGV